MRRYTLLIRILPKVMAVLLVLTLLMPLAPVASAAESGTCGEDLKWSFADGTLTITGRGAMTDYSYHSYAPWYSFREEIYRLELPKELTHVGSMAFYGCENLQTISLPSKVESVGEMAFAQCAGALILNLNDGLKSIGRSAFEQCSGVQDIRLPQSLTTIGRRAFYRCESLRYITIPGSVTQMDDSVFAYCAGLLRADVHAPLQKLPHWTFYGCKSLTAISLEADTTALGERSLEGCGNLSTVYYGGTEMDAEELKEQIVENQEDFAGRGEVSTEDPGNSSYDAEVEVNEDGSATVTESTVTQTEEAVITTTTETEVSTEGELTEETRIEATIQDEEGWDQVQDAIEDAVENGPVDATIYDASGTDMPQEFIDALTGKDVTAEVYTGSGSHYSLDFSMVGTVKLKNGLDLSYTLTLAEEVKYEQFQGSTVYELEFSESSEIPVGVAIQLPLENVRATASLYQVRGGKLEHLQAAVVDQKGVVHFYLASVDKGTTYFIGINIAGINTSDAYIPQSMEGEYGITEQIRDVDYVITGRKSSWGLNFLEVNEIMIGFMLSTAAIVGLLMYALNKRKLRRGMTPGWEDDESET